MDRDGRQDEERDDESGLELDPTDPSHFDYDLSEAQPYSAWDPDSKVLPLRPWLIALVSLILVIALLFPAIALLLSLL